MKTYTGMELTNAGFYVQIVKEAFKNYEDLYKTLFDGMRLVECDVRKGYADLIFKGKKHDLPFSMKICIDSTKKRYGSRVSSYECSYETLGKTITMEENSSFNYANNATRYDSDFWRTPKTRSVEELLTWIDSAPKNFEGCKIRFVDWAELHPAEFKQFSGYVNEVHDMPVDFYEYSEKINHFVTPYHSAVIEHYLGIDDEQRPIIFVCPKIVGGFEENEKLIMKLVSGINLKSIPVFSCARQCVKCYSIDEARELVNRIKAAIETYLDGIATEHSFEWRGLEYTHDGPIGVPSVDEANKAYENRCIEFLEKQLTDHEFDYRKYFGIENRTDVGIGSFDLRVKYSKTFTATKYTKGKKTTGKITYGIGGEIFSRNLKQAMEGKERLDYYSAHVWLRLPLVYRTIEGTYYTFDEAWENNTMGGPIDVQFKRTDVYYSSLCDERDKKLRNDEIERQALGLAFRGTDKDRAEFKLKHHDYLNRHALYMDKLLGEYEAQYQKYLTYVASM